MHHQQNTSGDSLSGGNLCCENERSIEVRFDNIAVIFPLLSARYLENPQSKPSRMEKRVTSICSCNKECFHRLEKQSHTSVQAY